LIIPIVKALRALGGSASIEELNDKMTEILALPEDVLAFRRDGAGMNEVPYRAAWARTYLRRGGLAEPTLRGVWTLTSLGRTVGDSELISLPKRVRVSKSEGNKKANAKEASDTSVADDANEELSWKQELLEVLRSISSDAFERLSQRLLRESGFTKVEVTGRSGDGGIDGIGVLRINLLSFHVLFQSKRYKDTVGPSIVRDFRGAMVGRSDKGLLITTGRFSQEARREATRDGAPPIELIDGDELCDLLRQLRIGVEVETVERVSVKPEVFKAM
jgi:restriction system protein